MRGEGCVWMVTRLIGASWGSSLAGVFQKCVAQSPHTGVRVRLCVDGDPLDWCILGFFFGRRVSEVCGSEPTHWSPLGPCMLSQTRGEKKATDTELKTCKPRTPQGHRSLHSKPTHAVLNMWWTAQGRRVSQSGVEEMVGTPGNVVH